MQGIIVLFLAAAGPNVLPSEALAKYLAVYA